MGFECFVLEAEGEVIQFLREDEIRLDDGRSFVDDVSRGR